MSSLRSGRFANGILKLEWIAADTNPTRAKRYSTPNGTFTIHYYGNTVCDPSQNGEGQTLLGSASVTADANGNATLPLFTAAADLIVTATATSSTGTSSSSRASSSASSSRSLRSS